MNPKQDLKASGCVYLSPKPPAPVAPLASKPMPGPLPRLCSALAHTDPIKREMAAQPLCHTFPFETVLHLPPVLLRLFKSPSEGLEKRDTEFLPEGRQGPGSALGPLRPHGLTLAPFAGPAGAALSAWSCLETSSALPQASFPPQA